MLVGSCRGVSGYRRLQGVRVEEAAAPVYLGSVSRFVGLIVGRWVSSGGDGSGFG